MYSCKYLNIRKKIIWQLFSLQKPFSKLTIYYVRTKIIYLLCRDAVWKETSTGSFEILCTISGYLKWAKSWDAKECNTSWQLMNGFPRGLGSLVETRLQRTCQWSGGQCLRTASIRTESERRAHFWTLLKRETQFSSSAGLHYFCWPCIWRYWYSNASHLITENYL